jgi:hypothetical protein
MLRQIKCAIYALLAVSMMVAALWTWRHAARFSQSDVQWPAVRSAAIALAAGAQILAVLAIFAVGNIKDRLLRAIGFAAAGVCVVGIVSTVALALTGR